MKEGGIADRESKPEKNYDQVKEKTLVEGGEAVDPGTRHFIENPRSINPKNKVQLAMIKYTQQKQQSVSDMYSNN